jgi:hypothetical protein
MVLDPGPSFSRGLQNLEKGNKTDLHLIPCAEDRAIAQAVSHRYLIAKARVHTYVQSI